MLTDVMFSFKRHKCLAISGELMCLGRFASVRKISAVAGACLENINCIIIFLALFFVYFPAVLSAWARSPNISAHLTDSLSLSLSWQRRFIDWSVTQCQGGWLLLLLHPTLLLTQWKTWLPQQINTHHSHSSISVDTAVHYNILMRNRTIVVYV